MRQRMGALLIGLIQSNLNVYRREDQLVITLNQAIPESKRHDR